MFDKILKKLFSRREDAHESKLRFKSVEDTLQRIKNKQYPEIPKSCKEIEEVLKKPETFENFGHTLTKKNQLYIGSEVNDKFSFHVFASISVIEFIKENISVDQRFYLIDGTFKIVPRKLSQLLIISIEFKNDVSKKPKFKLFRLFF